MPFGIENIKSWFIAHFLKEYNLPNNQSPVRRPKDLKKINDPVFRDKYAERLDDPEFRRFDDMVHQVVANVKAGLEPED